MAALTASEARATTVAHNMRRKLGARVRDAEAAAAAAKKQADEAVAACNALKVPPASRRLSTGAKRLFRAAVFGSRGRYGITTLFVSIIWSVKKRSITMQIFSCCLCKALTTKQARTS